MSSTEENKENVDAEKSDKTDGKSETPKQEKTPKIVINNNKVLFFTHSYLYYTILPFIQIPLINEPFFA